MKVKRPVTQEDNLIGVRMRLARKEAGYTQATLAKEFKISPQQIQKLESGQNKVSAKMLFRLAQLCGKQVEWFLQDLNSEGGEVLGVTSQKHFMMKVQRQLQKIEDKKLQHRVISFLKLFVEENAA